MVARPALPARTPRRRLPRDLTFALALMLPGLVWYLGLNAYPALHSFWISFHKWRIIGESEWTGLQNYARVFNDPVNLFALRNTALYILIAVPGQVILGFALAALVNRPVKFAHLFRMVYYFPVVSSWVVVSIVFQFLFHPSGLVNYVFADLLRLYPEGRTWFSDPTFAVIAISVLGIWKGVGWVMAIYLAALQSVPRELEEAATVDGASRWGVTRFVTLPLLRPTTMFVVVITTGWAFQSFVPFYIITRGRPNHQTEVFLTYVYDQAFGFYDFGYAAAIAFMVALAIFVVGALQLRYFRGGAV